MSEGIKAMLWECVCGHMNYAPAIQQPAHVAVCESCGANFAWASIPLAKKVYPRERKTTKPTTPNEPR